MEIIPAVDLLDGSVVRLTKGKRSMRKEYRRFRDPAAAVANWQNLGAKIIHVVDLNGAFGDGDNSGMIHELAKLCKVKLQIGGGIRTLQIARDYLKISDASIVLGSLLFEGPDVVSALLAETEPEQVIAALDYLEGRIFVRGWKKATSETPSRAIEELMELGLNRFILTDISRDGTLRGPDVDFLRSVCNSYEASFIAAGGISNLKELEALRDAGVWGAIVGKALYEGNLKLQQALDVARSGR
jgi:phosphoribosylformimino-5-aminoimidazole carboxamide ribotide isomerase